MASVPSSGSAGFLAFLPSRAPLGRWLLVIWPSTTWSPPLELILYTMMLHGDRNGTLMMSWT